MAIQSSESGLYWRELREDGLEEAPTLAPLQSDRAGQRLSTIVASGVAGPADAVHFALSCGGRGVHAASMLQGALDAIEELRKDVSGSGGCALLALPSLMPLELSPPSTSVEGEAAGASRVLGVRRPASPSSQPHAGAERRALRSLAAHATEPDALVPVDTANLGEILRDAPRFLFEVVTRRSLTAAGSVTAAGAATPSWMPTFQVHLGRSCIGFRRPIHLHALSGGGCGGVRLHMVLFPDRANAAAASPGEAGELTARPAAAGAALATATGAATAVDSAVTAASAVAAEAATTMQAGKDVEADVMGTSDGIPPHAHDGNAGARNATDRQWLPPPPRLSLRMLQWNVLDGCANSPQRLGGIGRWVRARDIDVLTLNEMNGWTGRTFSRLAQSWGFQYSSLLETATGYHLAIASKLPMVVEVCEPSPSNPSSSTPSSSSCPQLFLHTHLHPHPRTLHTLSLTPFPSPGPADHLLSIHAPTINTVELTLTVLLTMMRRCRSRLPSHHSIMASCSSSWAGCASRRLTSRRAAH